MLAVNLIILTQITIMLVLCDEEIEQDFIYHQKYIFHKDRKEDYRRILGGSTADETGFSFAVGLLNRGKSTICSGSIIAPTFVLTAAHCTDMFYVHKSIKDNKSGQLKVYEAKEYYPHPGFHYTTGLTGIDQLVNDIAILQTKDNMVKGWVKPIPLSSESISKALGNLGTVAGFGHRGMYAGADLRNLQHTNLQLATCPQRWSITICGHTPNNVRETRAVCTGDSGGPMVYKGKLLGVNVVGPSICTSFLSRDAQSAFTLVSAYVPWIHSELRKRIGKANLDSILSFTTSPTPIFGARINKSIKNYKNDNMKNSVNIIYEDIYYNNGKTNQGASVLAYYVVIFTMLVTYL